MLPTDNNLESEFTFENAAVPVPDELPFHILILGNWSGDSIKKDLNDRRPVSIDRDNFDDVLKKFNVSLELDWQGSEAENLSLEFSELEDFHPDNLFRNVSLFSDLRDIRRRLANPDTFNRAANEVRAWFENKETQTNTPSSQPQDADALPVETDNLLDMILSNPSDSPAAARPRIVDNSDLGRLVSKLVSPHLIKIDENEQSNLIAAVDDTISELMRAILHHPKFQSLESAWRGLYFLVRRVETDSDLKIFISDVSKPELADNLKTVNDLGDSFLYRQLKINNLGNSGEDSFAVIGADFSFELNVDDVAALMRAGKIASFFGTPFISYIKPQIFGIADFANINDLSQIKAFSDSNEEKLWNALRSIPEADSLGLSPMRLLARLPYGASSDSIETFSFEEFSTFFPHEHFLWINPCFSLILLLARSYRLYGWEMANNLRSDIENLPLYTFQENGEIKIEPCAEIVLTESALEKILEQGFIPFLSSRNADSVRVARFQSISLSNSKLRARW